MSTLVSDANFTCPALDVDQWTSECAPTFAYQFNDDRAPERVALLRRRMQPTDPSFES